MPTRESLYHQFPDHRVDLEPSDAHIRVHLAGELVAETRRPLRVIETKHEPVWYVPREDVRFAHLQRTDHSTFCPFKGDASYWTLSAKGRVEENAAWSYEDPFEEVAGIRDHIAFYADRVDWTID